MVESRDTYGYVDYAPDELLDTGEDEMGFLPGAARPLCVFCGTPWTDEMICVEVECEGSDSCGWSASADLTIKCATCNRLIYQKSGYR